MRLRRKTAALDESRPFAPICAQTSAEPASAASSPRRVIVEDRAVEAELPALESTPATRLPERIIDTPRSVQVITRRTFEDRIHQRPAGGRANVSGVARAASFNGVGEGFILRGFLQPDLMFKLTMVDAATGELFVSRELPGSLKAVLVAGPLHFGDYAGMPLKIIWALFTVFTIVLCVGGIYLTVARIRARRAEAPAAAIPAPEPALTREMAP